MSETRRNSRRAQDTLVVLGLCIAGLGLVIGGALLPIPMLGLIGLPLAGLSALLFLVLTLSLGGFEVPWPRQVVGLAGGLGGLVVSGWAYLSGLGTIAEHFLGRAGAPPLSELWHAAAWLSVGVAAIAGSIVARRAHGGMTAATSASAVTAATALLGWGALIVLAILGVPLGA